LRITYTNPKVEKYFSDFNKLKKALPDDWVRTIKKHLDRLEAADCFGDFLKLGLGRPEPLSGYKQIRYSLRVSANARLIIEPNATQDTIMICDEIEIEGVSDYHGDKENWYIP
jgi:proteic killer suppression protein